MKQQCGEKRSTYSRAIASSQIQIYQLIWWQPPFLSCCNFTSVFGPSQRQLLAWCSGAHLPSKKFSPASYSLSLLHTSTVSVYWIIPINIAHKLIISFLKCNKTSFLDFRPYTSCHSISVLHFTAKFLKSDCFSLSLYLHHLYIFFFSLPTPVRHLITALYWNSPHWHNQRYLSSQKHWQTFHHLLWVKLYSLKRYVEILTRSTREYNLI